MRGLMLDYQLTIPAMLRRAEQLFGGKAIVTPLPDKSFHRYTYADFVRRAKRLAVALRELGVGRGDRVATLCWNHHQHLEAYFGVPSAGAVLHTLNLRLHPDELAFIVNHAGDRVLLVDHILLPLFERFRERVKLEHVVVVGAEGDVPAGMLDYEQLLAEADESHYEDPDLDENDAAAMCYTSGTTGRPKGVLYSHRAIALHSLAAALADTLGVREADVVLPVVPMFHVNAWGLPFAATLVGAKQVFPGPHLDPGSLLEDLSQERGTLTAGVPTIWLGILQELDRNPGRWDLSSLRAMVVGGSAAPRGMIQAFQERHGLRVVHAWGMTETTPLGTVSTLTPELQEAPADVQYDYRAKQGRPIPFIEIRARNDQGLVPWDGQTMGELEIRGPWVASAYFEAPEAGDRWTDDGWLRTGDIVTIDPQGYIEIKDRAKDLVKSGGEWISSVALENELMAHPAVAEAAVIAVPHPKWQERPLAVVVLKPGQSATKDELLDFLRPKFAKWWLPDDIVFVDQIPRTSTGKFLKQALRERFRDHLTKETAS
ncbi:fatty-acid--CoA ligase [Thermaerobacter sp. FW80]|uniref:long-chain fatty acid--CoA ligase n=1 Tax=Thermaerobacter sp. FW80 TaxID=2546351 RepID=UPI00107589BB|nr:long-chain fatty acid--CoA ligase [Thermaerobacter sp. FW80]QBS37393.1 fatty-acid--CoA ligase [Thermaerobacter sp. FW80]